MRCLSLPPVSAVVLCLSRAGLAADRAVQVLPPGWYSGSAPITVDGDLSDWDAVSQGPFVLTHRCPLLADGSKPLQASFRVLADHDYVYVAITGKNDHSANHGSVLTRLADLQIYGGTTLNHVRYQKYRGIDGSISISSAADGTAVLGGAVRLPSDGDAGTLLECPHLWELLGTKVGLKRTDRGFTAEVAIPTEALGWQSGSPPGRLRLNVRVFGSDAEGAPTALQWADDPLNTSGTSHELLGTVTFTPVASSQPAKPKDAAPGSFFPVLQQLASGHAADAISALLGASDPRTLPLLSIAYRWAGQPEAARAILQRLAAAKTPGPPGDWATRQLAAPEAFAATGNADVDRLVTEGMRSFEAGRWAEAAGVFRNIAESKTTPVTDRVWSLLQVQKCQLAAGAAADSITTGWEIQRTASDGDPNRRDSLDRIMAVFFSNSQSLERARQAIMEDRQPEPLYAAYSTQLRARTDGIGCWQELELGELMRVEAATPQAIDHYRAASRMPTCPRADRAWALLLLQRAHAALGQTTAAISAAMRINADFADEWDVLSASLAEASNLPGTQAEMAALGGALVGFRASLMEPSATGAEARHALAVLEELNRSLRSAGARETR